MTDNTELSERKDNVSIHFEPIRDKIALGVRWGFGEIKLSIGLCSQSYFARGMWKSACMSGKGQERL